MATCGGGRARHAPHPASRGAGMADHPARHRRRRPLRTMRNPGYSRRPGAALHPETIATSTDYGHCTDTSTDMGQVDGGGSPSAFGISVSRDQRVFTVNRTSPGIRAPRRMGWWTGTYVSKRVDCQGYEETGLPGLLHVVEGWTPWPFRATVTGSRWSARIPRYRGPRRGSTSTGRSRPGSAAA